MNCSCCGKDINTFILDRAYQMPDAIWRISPAERMARAQIDADLCKLDDRYFLRGVLRIAIEGSDRFFEWGVWVEVPGEDFFAYVRAYERDNSRKQPFLGILANEMAGYTGTRGLAVTVQLGTATQRPAITVADTEHSLGQDQRQGYALERVHEFHPRPTLAAALPRSALH
ncbi:DUF2199 domain-containing protein [Allohahella marinimesophila]|uniref:DUF2199 domain-containing protein n=1 Tax=Allohahella marinimesophila TaxID=1054972 RepID=A0ABP7P912_9GAMM